jgi:hypothetical protein
MSNRPNKPAIDPELTWTAVINNRPQDSILPHFGSAVFLDIRRSESSSGTEVAGKPL